MVIFGEKAKIKKSRIKNSQIWSAKADSSDYGHSLTQDSEFECLNYEKTSWTNYWLSWL